MTLIETIVSKKDYIMFDVCAKKEDIESFVRIAHDKNFVLICVSNAGIKQTGVLRLTFVHENELKDKGKNLNRPDQKTIEEFLNKGVVAEY